MQFTIKFFREIKKKDIDKMSNKQLAVDFKKTIEYAKKLFYDYFWTEYFCLDKVTEILEEGDQYYNIPLMKKNIEKMSKLKYEQRKYLNQTFYPGNIFEKYFEVIAKRLKLKNIHDYSYKELIEMLNGKKIKIPNRLIFVKGKFSGWEDILGEEAKKIIKQLDINTDIKEFKGQTGNRGYYKGMVKKIEFSSKTDFSKEIKKMRKGDVLVSGSTGPEMIKACHKAGAIVTDEGGITSHAATVSRELNIPSIVGTKIATKVLKDGDLVEIDANKGIVKLIKRK